MSKPKVFMVGVVAGIFLIIMGATITTGTLEREYCYDVVNQTLFNATTNVTTYSNYILCDTYTIPFDNLFKLAIGSLFMLLGLGYVLYVYGTGNYKSRED
ncbi:MAG TPA: hypothetical protein PLG47_03550 [Candidatus Dojkabacteria bacterium]|nr:hypothetical protein [Candidatus Dojkabacteria bacterium]